MTSHKLISENELNRIEKYDNCIKLEFSFGQAIYIDNENPLPEFKELLNHAWNSKSRNSQFNILKLAHWLSNNGFLSNK